MTTDFGFLNLREQVFPPLGIALRQQKSLIATLSQIMAAYGARPSELLTTYTDATVVWEIPCLYSDTLLSTSLNPSFATRTLNAPSSTYELYLKVLDIVASEGFGHATLYLLTRELGKRVAHPMYFTRTEPSPSAQALFGLEWACLNSYVHKGGIFQDNHAFVRSSASFLTTPMGVVRGVCGSSSVTSAEDLQEWMYRPRGFIEFETYDSLDRANLWVVQNAGTLLEPEKMLRGLSLLKLSQNVRVAYEFEQALRKLEQPKPMEPTLKSLLYTDDALDQIRDIWTDQHSHQAEKLEKLHTKLVPEYLDSQQFKDIFKIRGKPSSRFSLRVEEDAVAGIEAFIKLFLQTRRAISEGKQVYMEG